MKQTIFISNENTGVLAFESGQESLLVISARIPKAGMWIYITGLSFINANLSCYIDPQ